MLERDIYNAITTHYNCRMRRHRRLHEPEVLGRSDDESEEEIQRPTRKIEADESSEEEEEELDEEVRKLSLIVFLQPK